MEPKYEIGSRVMVIDGGCAAYGRWGTVVRAYHPKPRYEVKMTDDGSAWHFDHDDLACMSSELCPFVEECLDRINQQLDCLLETYHERSTA